MSPISWVSKGWIQNDKGHFKSLTICPFHNCSFYKLGHFTITPALLCFLATICFSFVCLVLFPFMTWMKIHVLSCPPLVPKESHFAKAFWHANKRATCCLLIKRYWFLYRNTNHDQLLLQMSQDGHKNPKKIWTDVFKHTYYSNLSLFINTDMCTDTTLIIEV